jgi:hypothetical protein
MRLNAPAFDVAVTSTVAAGRVWLANLGTRFHARRVALIVRVEILR